MHVLVRKHSTLLSGRAFHIRKGMRVAAAITWLPGEGNNRSFRDRPIVPLNLSEAVVSSSHMTSDRHGRPRDQIYLRAYGCCIDPDNGDVMIGGEENSRYAHDFTLRPVHDAKGLALDAAKQLPRLGVGIDLDRERERVFSRAYKLPAFPIMPDTLLGFTDDRRPPMHVTPSLERACANRHGYSSVKAMYAKCTDDTVAKFLRDTWDAAWTRPDMPGNNTGLWLIDALFSPRYVRRTVRVFQDFRSLLGQPIWNPARDLLNTAGEIKCDNPARAVLEAAGIDVQAVLTDPDHFNSTDEATHTSLVAAMRKALGAGERYFTEEDILVSILQPDKPAVGTAKLSKDALLAVLGEKAAIDGMRKLLGASLAGCATDEDLLAGLSDPGGQLTLSGACRIQTWRVDQRQMAESFQFTYDQLSIDLWSSRWSKDFEPRKPMQFKARKPETQAPAPTEVENATSVVPVG